MSRSARDAAFAALYACRKNDDFSDAALKDVIDKYELDKRDAALASRICYGVLQNRLLLDFYLEKFCSRPLKKLEPALPDILRIGAYQILFLDKVPDTAAVNEAVKMAKKRASARGAGLVNGVLRAVSAGKKNLPDIPRDDTVKYFSIKYSHPEWLVNRIFSVIGDKTEDFLACNNGEAPTVCRINRLTASSDDVIKSLENDGVDAEKHPWIDDSIVLTSGGDVRKTTAFKNGDFFVQDSAATLSVLAAAPEAGMKILDVCSAPGGKSFAAVSLCGGNCSVASRDASEKKIPIIKKGASRLKMDGIITAEAADGRVMQEKDKEKFDLVIVDAPCSGLGIIRKKPDIRYKSEEELQDIPQIQLSILNAASAAVKEGGVLMYSTCTILPVENEEVVKAFLNAHDDFAVESFVLPGPIGKVESGMITLWPHIHDTDGFFVCRMRRLKKEI